jgi:hypothetical protein
VKIALFGNTNNYPYFLALGLRNLGVTVHLVVNRPDRLHRPALLDAPDGGGLRDWVMDCADVPQEDFVSQSSSIANVLNHLAADTQGVILNDIGPSLAGHLSCPWLALLTGSDLTYFGDFGTLDAMRQVWSPEFKRSPGGRHVVERWAALIARQRNGILGAKAVSFAPPGVIPAADALLQDIGVVPGQRFFVWLTTALERSPRPASKGAALRILNGARLNWVEPLPPQFSDQDNKRTDILLRGFAAYVSSGGKGELRLFRKGLHVVETAALVQELGIGPHVVWLDELGLDGFVSEMREADVVCDQLGPSFPGLVGLDGMALAKPVIANFRLDVMGNQFPEPFPVCNARTSDEVCAHLHALSASCSLRTEIGQAARAFAQRHLSPEANALKCLAALGLDAPKRGQP